MVISVNLDRVQAHDVRAGVSPLAELMASLHVLAEPDHHSESRAWATQIVGAVDDTLRSDLRRFAPLWARYRMRLFFPWAGPLGRDIDEEIDHLCDAPDDLFLPLVANAIRGGRTPWTGAEEVLSTTEWLTECEQKSFHRGDLAYALVSDHRRFRRELAGVLRRANTAFFARDWQAHGPRLGAVADQVNEDLATRNAADVVVSLAQMASRRGDTQTIVFDKLQHGSVTIDTNGMLLVPSFRTWPHVMVKMDPDLPVVIQFMAQEIEQGNASPSQQEVRRRLAILSEPGRWELCRHLIGESITTSDLAKRTNQTEPAVSRHLKLMREAGLITSQRDGRHVFHRMHPTVIMQLSHDALKALMR